MPEAPPTPDFGEINSVSASADLIFSKQRIEAAIDKMAKALSERLGNQNPLVLAVLNGGIIITAMLMLRLKFPLILDSVSVSRYRNTTHGHALRWVKPPSETLKNRVVVLIDDILDEGITLAEIKTYCLAQGAKAVYSAVLVDKKIGTEKPIKADFVGLTCENRYLFGYGMDYKGYLRNRAEIFACADCA